MGPGRVKTPSFNLRVERLSKFRRCADHDGDDSEGVSVKDQKLKAKPLTVDQYEGELVARGIWSTNGVWYTSQKDDW